MLLVKDLMSPRLLVVQESASIGRTQAEMKLAHIRRVKASRFKAALIATVAAYAVIIAAFFIVGRCF